MQLLETTEGLHSHLKIPLQGVSHRNSCTHVLFSEALLSAEDPGMYFSPGILFSRVKGNTWSSLEPNDSGKSKQKQ